MIETAFSYCGPQVSPGDLWLRWNFDPPLVAALMWVAAASLIVQHRETATLDARSAAAGGGMTVLAVAFLSPLCALSATLYTARVIHHLLLVAVAAPLVAIWLAPLIAGRFRTLPGLAAAVHAVAFWVWHSPAAYAAAMSNSGVYWFMELSLLATAVWFWASLLAVRASPPAYLTILVGFSAQMGLLGAILVFAPDPLFTPHFGTTAIWGLTPLEDQQLAGLVMWVPGVIPYLFAAVAGLGLWARSALRQSLDI